MNLNKIVTPEQAKLLAELGFGEEVNCYYDKEELKFHPKGLYYNFNQDPIYLSAPLQTDVVSWLQVNHKLWISVFPHGQSTSQWGLRLMDMHSLARNVDFVFHNLATPELAYSAGIDYVLNRLKNESNIQAKQTS